MICIHVYRCLGNLYHQSGNRLMKRIANGDSVAVFNEVRKWETLIGYRCQQSDEGDRILP